MKRPAVLVLLLTFLALVVATFWVPSRAAFVVGPGMLGVAPNRASWPTWRRIGDVRTGPHVGPSNLRSMLKPELDRTALAIEYGLLLAIGGLVVLALHTRERRKRAAV